MNGYWKGAIASAVVMAACSPVSETAGPDIEARPVELQAPSPAPAPVPNRLVLERAAAPLQGTDVGWTALPQLTVACTSADIRLRPQQNAHVVFGAWVDGEGTLRLQTGTWDEEGSTYRNFDLAPQGAELRAEDGVLVLDGNYDGVRAFGYVLDDQGEVVFAGPPPVELPVRIPCDDPQVVVTAASLIPARRAAADRARVFSVDRNVAEWRAALIRDSRLDPLIAACRPDEAAVADSVLISAGLVEGETMAYQGQLVFTTLRRETDTETGGTITADVFTAFFPPSTLGWRWTDDGLVLSSDGESVSGVSYMFHAGGRSEPNDFENVAAEMPFTCADRVSAGAVLSGVRAYLRRGRTAPPDIGIAVEMEPAELSCDLDAATARTEIERTVTQSGLNPVAGEDLTIVLSPVAANADARTGCEYAATLTLAGESPISPRPARNQNYEIGTEVVDQGLMRILDRYWDTLQSDP